MQHVPRHRLSGRHLSIHAVRIALLLAAVLASAPADAQMVQFKHFKRYPTSGQWQQELVGYRDGQPLGPPAITTSCSGPLDPKAIAGIAEVSKQVFTGCTARVITDTETLAESETVCTVGAGVQTLHQQMRPIDDKTIASETRSTMPGQPATLMKSKVTYLGPCVAGSAAAATPKPSREDCAQLAQMRQDNAAAGGAAQCAQLPAPYRAQCETNMVAGTKAVAAIEQMCR